MAEVALSTKLKHFDTIDFLGYLGTLSAHIQPAVDQHL